MDEHRDHPHSIPSSSKQNNDRQKPSESAPILPMNASSSSIDMFSSKNSLPDTIGSGHKSKTSRSHEKSSHKDFPEIRAYYAK